MSRSSPSSGKFDPTPTKTGSLPEDPRGKVVALALAMLAGLFFLFYWKGSFQNPPREFIPPVYPRPEPVEKRDPGWEPSLQFKQADGGEIQVRFAPELREDATKVIPSGLPRQTFSRPEDAPRLNRSATRPTSKDFMPPISQ